MNQALSHRGPDDAGHYADGPVALGHRRLSIIDLSAAGHQPMASPDGRYHLVYNGEIYNYRELRTTLKDYPFQTQTDSEVLLAAFLRWKEQCLNHLNGMFAFAVWDRVEQQLFIARDRLGIKPLYCYQTDELFVFSSEVRALLASDLVPRKLDQDSLSDFFRYQTVHAPHTILEDVRCLMPGSYMTVDRSRSASTVYWKLNPAAANEAANEDYATVCKSVNERLYQAVERRLVADVPFGAFLSGGIDSSAIVGIMAAVSREKPRTFSIVFDEPEFSEQPYSDLIAKRFDTEHHPLKLNVNRFLEGLPDALAAMDHPSGDGPNTYVVSEVTRQAGITMALSGLGGDELFAGYDIFNRSLSLEKKRWLNALPRGLRQQMGSVVQRMRPGIAGDKMAGILAQPRVNYLDAYPFSRLTLNEQQLRQVLRDAPAPNRVAAWGQQWDYRSLDPNRVISTVSALELSTYLQNVLLRDSDQMSMAHALEVRVPFMDHTLVEYVLGLPDHFKRPTSPKRLLIDALDGLLPDAIINRPKMGFTFPWAQWLKHELGAFSAQRLKSLQERSTFNSQGIDLLWRQFQQGDPAVSWSRVWPLIVLGNWLEQHRIDS